MRIRHAMAAGTGVALLSAATTLMASATASAGVTTQTLAQAPVSQIGTAPAGSAAGLVLGMLFVLGTASISFVVRVGAGRRMTGRVISVPEARFAQQLAPAFAE